jgi:hypothetical protein
MGKKDFDSNFASMKDLMEEEKKLKRKMSKLKIPCSHTNDKGKIKVDFIKGTLARCKKCDCVFDFERIDIDDLDAAVQTIHNAINQIKALSNDPDKEATLIRELGTIDFNLTEMADLYKRTITKYGKDGGKKKKHNDNNSFGSYGASNISFIDSGKRKY